MTYSEKISNKLNELLEKTYDAENGYKLARDLVENPSVKRFLDDKVRQRYVFGNELKEEIEEFGKFPKKDGSLKGDLHRTWMKLSTTLSGDDTERVLEEVERGEKVSLEAYDKILNEDNVELPPSTENLLRKQHSAIYSALQTAEVYEELVS